MSVELHGGKLEAAVDGCDTLWVTDMHMYVSSHKKCMSMGALCRMRVCECICVECDFCGAFVGGFCAHRKNGIAYVKCRSDEVHSVCLCVSGVPGDDRGRIKTRNATMEDQDTVSAMKEGRYQ